MNQIVENRPRVEIIYDLENKVVTKIRNKPLALPAEIWVENYNFFKSFCNELIDIFDVVNIDKKPVQFSMPYLDLKGDFFKVFKESTSDDKNTLYQNYNNLLNNMIKTSKHMRHLNKKKFNDYYFFHRDFFAYNIHVDANNNLHVLDPDSFMFVKKENILSQINSNYSLLNYMMFENETAS